jgi:iron complex outermembrane receptor protein
VNICRAVCLGTVSFIALSTDAITQAYAQSSTLPAVTVDAPQRQATRRTAPPKRSTASRGPARRAAAPLRQVEPVRYVAPSTSALGTLPAPYAGGQVASGGQLGLLGNRGVMDTPFNQTSYTAELIKNQQARTIGDVLMNDPSVRVKTPNGNGIDGLYIRGFYYDSGDYALNGLYGLAPFYSSAANYVERVEVLKGPAALLNGMPLAGAVGGSINLVTKRAPDVDITQLTATYASKTQGGVDLDVSRRYGDHKEFGVRYNGSYRKGETAYDRQGDEFGNSVLNLDYRGERVRVSTDFGYQTDNLTPPLRFITFTPGIPVPPAPSAGTNYMPSWAKWKPKDYFAMTRGEVDLTDSVTAYGAVGYHDSTIDYIYPSPRITNIGGLGNWQASPFMGRDVYKTLSGEAGLRADVDTGPINHLLTVNYSAADRSYYSLGNAAATVFSNLYNPVNVPLPASFPTTVQNLSTSTTLSSVGFADTMSMLDRRLQLTVGVRRQTVGTSVFNVLTPTSNADSEMSIWSPAYALVVKPVEHISLYANYIEGLKAAEVVTGGTVYSNVGEILPAYQTKQTEFGMKIDAGRLTATISAFEITNPNTASVAVPGRLPAKKLAGEQVNRGIELNVFGEVTPEVRLLGGVALINGKVVAAATSAGAVITSLNGKTAVGVPAVSANIGGEWDTPFIRGLTFTGRVIYTSDQYADDANLMLLPAWTRVDLGARYTFLSPWNGKPIVIRANVENVGNAAYWNAYRTVSSAVSLGAPRTYLVSTTFNF